MTFESFTITQPTLGFGLEDFFTAGLEYLDAAAKLFEKHDEAVDKQRTPTVSRHNKQLHDWVDGEHTELLRRSPLGLTRVYNGLPQTVVDANSVSDFQGELQELVRRAASRREDNWELLLSPRRKQ